MTEINFKKKLVDADGKEQDVELSKILSDLIMQSNISDSPLKFFEWALELKKSGKLKLDSVDKEKLTKYIEDHQTLFVLPKGRMLQEMKDSKEAKK